MYPVTRSGVEIPVYFGGSYQEHWSEDYTLNIVYSPRARVNAAMYGGVWMPVGGDEEWMSKLWCAAPEDPIRRYFAAAADVYCASKECLRRGFPLTRLYEIYASEEPYAAPELMRLLMDDCGFSLETAYDVALRCCPKAAVTAAEAEAIFAYQPRTAHVVSILGKAKERLLCVEHDGRSEKFRDPPRAVRRGEKVELGFDLLGGSVNKADLLLHGDDFSRVYPMQWRDGGFVARFTAPQEAQALWYSMRIESMNGTFYLCPDETGARAELCREERGSFRFTVFLQNFETPEWMRHAVMYQVFPDRFAFSDDGTAEKGIAYHLALGQTPELHKSLDEPPRWQARPFEEAYSPDDFYGGTLKGIESKLPYLQELGISVLYLNPIVEARSNHRYDTSDYRKVDPILGTNEDFRRLCEAAKACGIRIILDGVYSHTGADSVYFNRYGSYPTLGACQGPESPYYKWYDFRHFPDDYRSWWGFADLPEVNELDDDWQRMVVLGEDSVVRHWLREGADGWRLDVADELPDEVLALIRRATKEENPEAPVIGEVWEDAIIKESYGGRRNYGLGYSLDSVMNYPFRKAVLDFAHWRIGARELRDFLTAQQMNYPLPMYYSLMNLLGSHDVERLKSALATDVNIKELPREQQLALPFDEDSLRRATELEKLCAALQFAVPGMPSIYYGDEQGQEGVCDPFNRGVFHEGDGELHQYYVNLSKLRNSDSVFATGYADFLAFSTDVLGVLRYCRAGRDAFGKEGSESVFLTVINRGGETDVAFDCSSAGCGVYHGHMEGRSAQTFKIR